MCRRGRMYAATRIQDTELILLSLRKSPDECKITSKTHNTLINMTKIHKRGRYSAALKEKVSLEALKGEKTLQQIASENNISPELVRQWKKQAQDRDRNGWIGASSDDG